MTKGCYQIDPWLRVSSARLSFKSLLHKAKVTTNIVVSDDQSIQQGASHPHDELFTVPKTEQEFIPCPQLFMEVVQRPWVQPSSLLAPNGHDKKLYCSAPNFQGLLHLPSVDAPVASLTSSTVLSNEVADGLRTEDRKAELAFRKTH